MREHMDLFRAILQTKTLSAEERWERVIAALEAAAATLEVAAIGALLQEAPDLPLHVRRTPKRWVRAVLAGQPIPWLPLVRVLDLRRMQLRDQDLAAIASLPSIAHVTHVKLYLNRVGDAGLAALAQSPYLGRMVSLNLTHNHIGAEGVRALTQAQSLAALKHLYLGRNRIGDRGAHVLATAPFVQRLDLLDVRGNNLTDAGIQTLLASPYLKACRVRIE